MSDKGMVRVTNGRYEALIVPSALAVWQRSGWGLVADQPQAPKEKRQAAKRTKAKPRTPKTPPAPADPPARDDSAERLESDEPETAPAEESA